MNPHHPRHYSPMVSARATTLPNPYYPNLPARLPALGRDFHLDTFFNPIWMSGPHVFSFTKEGKVARPKTFQPDPYPGYFTNQPLCVAKRLMIGQGGYPSPSYTTTSQRVNATATLSYADAVKVSRSNSLCDVQKPWKNVAITEHDGAEFEAITAASVEKQEKEQQFKFQHEPERKRRAVEAKLVCSWPPALSAIEEYDTSGDENEVPELSYSISPDTSQASEPEESPTIPAQEKRGDRYPFRVLHEKPMPFEEEPLEKVIGFERLRRKAPPSLHLDANEDINEDIFLFDRVGRMNEEERGLMQARVLSPLTAGIPVISTALLHA
ncbi:hypothetical protein PAXRUDRAFT_832143 [Paxillus rubicundulus Ve08.2h10]|uniref:Uncharacterized protein n=1 Tax=Paxillus rubicundulus Ve08.2h10 TaxID=930991 RepID=A0A0D0D3U0_9AGAM|nr:hypothetical protein PAXRUDRAFT_832143 [Paxillus rubicundulus Ve08.2h10]